MRHEKKSVGGRRRVSGKDFALGERNSPLHPVRVNIGM